MADRLRVACVQLNAGAEKAENIATAERLVGRGGLRPAPSWSPCRRSGTRSARSRRCAPAAEPLEGGETVEAMAGWARKHGITIVGGSITESREGREKLSNTCVVFSPEGEIAAVYRKIHLFDVEVGGHVYRESEAEEPGEESVVVETAGLARRASRSVTTCASRSSTASSRSTAPSSITVPAAFTLATGKDHWELLLRARAVENQCYVAAPNQWGITPRRQGERTGARSSSIPGEPCSRPRPTRTA